MGLFSATNPFDPDVERVTDAKNTAEDWGMIIDLCDKVQAVTTGPKDCLKAIIKRLNHKDPHVVIQAITLLDACVNNCGKPFRLEVASREFEVEFRKLLAWSHPRIKEKLKGLLKKWAEGEFKNDSALSLIVSLYNSLKKEGIDFSSSFDPTQKRRAGPPAAVSRDPNVVSNQQEEDDLAKAIQLSLQESSPARVASSHSTQSASLYPTANSLGSSASATSEKKDEKRARALYDFEAAEDNELTFKAGEIVIIIDDSDQNWWKGSNHRGEGLFPANFVTTDLESEPEKEEKQRRRSVQFNEEVEVKTVEESEPNSGPVHEEVVEISEARIDYVLGLLHEADPTSPEHDSPDLPASEDAVLQMGPLIDAELERVDRRHAQLTRLSTELVDALNLYHQLMHEMPAPAPMFNPAAMLQQPAGYVMPGAPYMTGPPSYHPSYLPAFNGYMPSDQNLYAGGSAPPPPTPPLSTEAQQIPAGAPMSMNPNPAGMSLYTPQQLQ